MKKPIRALSTIAAFLLAFTQAHAQDARALLDAAVAAMGGPRVEQLQNFVMTGFGQRYNFNGNISADPNSPPKWQAVATSERYFDLRGERALVRERAANMFPFAAPFGMSLDTRERVQTGTALLDHPLSALRAALARPAQLGPVTIEDGMAVVSFKLADGSPGWIALDPQTHLPYWARWVNGSTTLGDATNTSYFTGYMFVDGVQLPAGIMTKIDWRDQATLMFQVDSYRLDVPALPPFPAANAAPPRREPPEVATTKIADGVWDVRIANGGSGGAVVELADHLVMFEPYGNEAELFARLDAANKLVHGKQVTAVVVSHHHDDHAGGLRAAVARGLTIIAQRRTRALFEEWVSRPAVLFPDALAKNPRPLVFEPVDEHLVLEDSKHRLDVYHSVGDFHMSDALIAYLPKEKILMEGDFTDDTWTFNWWAGAIKANRDLYGIDPKLDIPVHGTPQSLDEKLAGAAKQVEAAQRFCAENASRGSFPLGCPGALLHDGARRAVSAARSCARSKARARPAAGDYSRRRFLTALGAAGAASLTPLSDAFGQSRAVKLNVRGGAIDVHHHFVPPGGATNRPWSPEMSLEQMDKFGIAVAILSMTQNGELLYNGGAKGRSAVRAGNEYGAELMQRYPQRFGLMGGIPMPDLEGSLREVEHAYDVLKADAIGIYTNDNQGRWPGDPYFEPLWQELNRRNAIVYMHPLAPTCCSDLKYGAAASMVEYDFDVTRGVVSLVVNGVMFRYPNIRFITVHSGGTVPMLAGRMNDRIPRGAEQYLPNGLYAELRKWYYDIAHATFPWPYAAMKAFMPESQILFGTDYSPEPIESTVDPLPALKLSRAFEQMMLRGNAERLFPRFKVK